MRSIGKDGEAVIYTDMDEGATSVHINSVVHILTTEGSRALIFEM